MEIRIRHEIANVTVKIGKFLHQQFIRLSTPYDEYRFLCLFAIYFIRVHIEKRLFKIIAIRYIKRQS